MLKKNFHWPIWPSIKNEHLRAVNRVLRKSQLFADIEVKKFENEFKKYNKSNYVKAVGNATQGLHLALSSLEIGMGDEVIVTGFSWISTASCILMQNAIPVFVDIETDTLGANPEEIEKKITKKTKAIIVVHMYGNMCKIDKIKKIAKKKKIFLIEDASHAHGAKFKLKKSGNFSDIAVFSCHQRKNLFCGEGGLVVSKNRVIDEKIRKLRSFGAEKLSYNYRMTEAYAAIGRVSLKYLDTENKLRVKNANYFRKILGNEDGFKIIVPIKNSTGVYHKLIINYNYRKFNKNLSHLIKYLQKNGVPASNVYKPLHYHSNFNLKKNMNTSFPNINLQYKKKNKLPVTEEFSLNRLFEISIHPPVNKGHIKKVYKLLINYKKKYFTY
jgi:perosamine synthetase